MKDEKYLWLENILGEEQIKWVEEENKKTLEHFKLHPKFKDFSITAMEISSRKEKMKIGRIHNDVVFNLWKDEKNPRGILRKTSRKSYLEGKYDWDLILDIDALGKSENESWVYKGSSFFGDSNDLALMEFSIGGQDAVEIREFNTLKKEFVENGYFVPESKSSVLYLGEDTVLLNDGVKDGTKTEIGYPRVVRYWKRGDSIEESKIIFEGLKSDVGTGISTFETEEGCEAFVDRSIDFYRSEHLYFDQRTCEAVKLPFPEDVSLLDVYMGKIIVQNRKTWKLPDQVVPSGSIVAFEIKSFIENKEENFEIVIKATSELSIGGIKCTKNYMYLFGTENISGVVFVAKKVDNKFTLQKLSLPQNGSIYLIDSDFGSDFIQVYFESFVDPGMIYSIAKEDNLKKLQSNVSKWDSEKYEVSQAWISSKDGTKIPYFLLKNKGTKIDGSNPTLMYGYGGFEIPIQPWYSELLGRSWLDNGGIFVLTNIRGGGEFGPEWHQAALLKNKQKSYDDFIAIAEDLIAKKITSPKHLGIEGGSNGGLLVGAVCMQRPDLFNAVLCQVPLLDMLRYTLMENAKGDRVGQSWAAEYGDPVKSADMNNYIKNYSPFQNISPNKKYPPIYFFTSTRDDRVVPSHARKMAAKMMDQGHKVWFYENIEGGHGGGADMKQAAMIDAMKYAYLSEQLGIK